MSFFYIYQPNAKIPNGRSSEVRIFKQACSFLCLLETKARVSLDSSLALYPLKGNFSQITYS